ncbi:MAG: hypothetical protein Q9M43_12340 [Sulfurimonas sp.]|nr:hypothetical protein [Sulfurimonas sp.]
MKAKPIKENKDFQTYGEACYIEKSSLYMVNGSWKKKIEIKNKPQRMKREDAARYYNAKLSEYWAAI